MVAGSLFLFTFILLAITPTRTAHAVDPVILTVDTDGDSLINSGCTENNDDEDCSLRGAIGYANANPNPAGYRVTL